MPAMLRRRLIALVAIFAVSFGALWPLVSAAKPRTAQIPNFICSQSGFQHPGAPGESSDDFHCPLCIASADGAVPVGLASHATPALHAIAVIAARHALPDHLFSPRPPPSRAPPVLS
jgi:hypothetical protein